MVQFATDPNPSDEYDKTPLHAAARGLPWTGTLVPVLLPEFRRRQQCAIVKLIIGRVSNKHPATWTGMTPLHFAAYNKDADVFSLILEHAANKNPAKANGRTPLHIAAEEGHFKVCKAILENVEDQHPKDIRGRTPLHWAAENGHIEVCRLMLEAENAEVACHQEDNDRYTPLQLAEEFVHLEEFVEIVALFKERCQ